MTRLLRLLGLTLFFCSLLALKSQEASEREIELEDHIMNGERAVFSRWVHKIFRLLLIYNHTSCSVVIDDKYDHALQIFKDEGSAGIRLLASVLRGRMKR